MKYTMEHHEGGQQQMIANCETGVIMSVQNWD